MTDPDLLAQGELSLHGRLVAASNGTFQGSVSLDGETATVVYKPVQGERPLWDFPDGTLAQREFAAYVVSEALGWSVVPPTLLRDGPLGEGMVQLWIDEAELGPGETELVDIVPQGRVPTGWVGVLDALDGRHNPVTLVHADNDALRRMAVFDAVVNNADRKGGHVLNPGDGRVYGVDHGVTFNADDKLRTVLWGWAGDTDAGRPAGRRTAAGRRARRWTRPGVVRTDHRGRADRDPRAVRDVAEDGHLPAAERRLAGDSLARLLTSLTLTLVRAGEARRGPGNGTVSHRRIRDWISSNPCRRGRNQTSRSCRARPGGCASTTPRRTGRSRCRPPTAGPRGCTCAASRRTTRPTWAMLRRTSRSTWSTGSGGTPGYDVHYTQNITDVDDPLLERATATGVDWTELATRRSSCSATT